MISYKDKNKKKTFSGLNEKKENKSTSKKVTVSKENMSTKPVEAKKTVDTKKISSPTTELQYVQQVAQKNKNEKYNNLVKASNEVQTAKNNVLNKNGYALADVANKTMLERGNNIGKTLSYDNRQLATDLEANRQETVRKMQEVISKDKDVQKKQKIADEAANDYLYADYLNNMMQEEGKEYNLWDKTGGRAISAIPDYFSSFGLGAKYRGENGREYALPSKYEIRDQNVAEQSSGLERFAGDVLHEGGKQMLVKGVNALTGGIGGSALYFTDIFGDTLKQNVNEGYDAKTSLANATLKTGQNYIKQKLMGGLNGQLTGGQTSELQDILTSKWNTLIKNPVVANILGSGSAEFIDEFTDTYIENIIDTATKDNAGLDIGKYLDVMFSPETFKEAFYSGAVGFGTGTVGGYDPNPEIIDLSRNKNSNKISQNQMQSAQQTAQEGSKTLPHSTKVSDVGYHASNEKFDKFDTSKIGTGQGDNTQGKGINLASVKEAVEGVYGKNTYETNINLENAYTVDDKKLLSTFEKDFGYKTDMDNISDELQKKGYDGIVIKTNNGNKLYTVFDGKNVDIINKGNEKVTNNTPDIVSNNVKANEKEINPNAAPEEMLGQIKQINESNNIKQQNNLMEAIRKDAEAFNLGRDNAEQNVQPVQTEVQTPNVVEQNSQIEEAQQVKPIENQTQTLETQNETSGLNEKDFNEISRRYKDLMETTGFEEEINPNATPEEMLGQIKQIKERYEYDGFLEQSRWESPEVQKSTKSEYAKLNRFINRFEGKLNEANSNIAETKSEPVIKAQENNAVEEVKEPTLADKFIGEDVDEDAFFKERMKQLEEQQESKTEAEPYTDNGEVAEILTETPKEPKKPLLERLNETRKKFTRDFISKGAEIEDLSRKYKNPNLNWTYDRLGIARAEAQQHIGSSQRNLDLKPYYNFIDSDGKMTSMSLNDIREDARTHNIPEAELNEYLAHYLNVDRYSQGKPVFGMNVDEDVSKQKIRQLEIQHPDIKRIAKNVWTFEQNQLQNMVDSGLISEQFAKELKEKNPHYVRIQRDVKGYSKNNRTINGENSVKVNQQIQTAKGGNQNILPIMEGIAKYTEQVHQSERMNLFGQELEKTLGMGSQNNSINSITDDESFGINPDIIKDNGDGTYSMTIFKDGTATVIPINKGIYESLTPNKMVQAVENDETFKKLSYPPKQVSKMFRTLTTDKNPVFMFTNAFRDIGDAPFNSKYTKEFTKAYVSGEAVKQVFTRGGYDQLLEAAGGRQNSYFADGEFTDKSQTKLDKARDKILYPIERGNEIVEATPRMAEFIATIKANGYDVNSEGEMYVANENKATRPANEVLNEALYNSAEVTTNFKRGGDVTKMLNRNGATFLNASVQGFDKQVRNFTQLDNPKQVVNLLTKALIFGIAPTILNDGMYDDDKEYEELEDYQKDNYYLFKTKNGIWVRIPKGRAMGVIGSLLRRTKNYAKGDKKAYEGFLDYASNQVAPNSVIKNNIFAPFFQVKNNKSWSGNKIISDSMIKRPTEEQYNEKTDEISKFIGKQIKDLPLPKELKNFKSPLAIHYLLDQYSGAIGDVILPMFTEKSSSKYNPLIAPFISKFTADAVYSNKSVSEYYDKKEKLDEKRYSENSTPLDVAKSSYMTSQAYEMSDLYKKQREIQNNKSLSKAQKYDQAREVQKEINKKAKQIVKNVDNAEEHEYYVKIGDYYYKKVYKDGQIKYVRDTSTKIPTESYALYDYYKKKYEKSKEEAKG